MWHILLEFTVFYNAKYILKNLDFFILNEENHIECFHNIESAETNYCHIG